MENIKLNTTLAKCFSNYLKKNYSWNYFVVGPNADLIPDKYPVDEILYSKTEKLLFLQHKRPISRDMGFTKSEDGEKVLMFNEAQFELTIEKAEARYKKQNALIKDIILLLHGYYDPAHDISFINKNKFLKSEFRGIYIISPEYIYYKNGMHLQKEFVFEIKNAFSVM